MIYAFRGFLIGLVMAVLVYFMERTTTQPMVFPSWLLIIGFPVCWTIAGYLFWKWDIIGYKVGSICVRKQIPHEWKNNICLRCGEKTDGSRG